MDTWSSPVVAFVISGVTLFSGFGLGARTDADVRTVPPRAAAGAARTEVMPAA
jgi:hypothetical protein